MTMSQPPSIFLHSGRKSAKNFQPFLTHPLKKATKTSASFPRCLALCLAHVHASWQPGYQILEFYQTWTFCANIIHCETQQWFSDPHRRLATSSVNINMCPQSTLLHGTAFYLTYFTTNYFSNDLGNGSFKDLRGVIVSSKHGVLTLQTVHITHAMNCRMH